MSEVRGFNFIADYGHGLDVDHIGDLKHHLRIISTFNGLCERYKDEYDNMEVEMKRFIAWFFWTYEKEEYDYMVSNDQTGFLKKCIELYDPEKGNMKPPYNAYDYSTDYDFSSELLIINGLDAHSTKEIML